MHAPNTLKNQWRLGGYDYDKLFVSVFSSFSLDFYSTVKGVLVTGIKRSYTGNGKKDKQ